MKRIFIYIVALLNFLILIGFWWYFSGALILEGTFISVSLAIGRLTGLLAVNLILTQLILIGRVKWVESVFGLDKLARIHKWSGYFILLLITLHPLFLIFAYSKITDSSYFTQFQSFLLNWDDVFKAFLAYLAFLVIVFLSVTIVRKRLKYESWYFVHIFTYLAIVFAFGHQLESTPDSDSLLFQAYWYLIYFIAFANIGWFRFIRPILNSWRFRFTVARVEKDGVATSIYITGKNLENFKIDAGQFMIFRFFQKGFWWQAHPFSLSKSPDGKELKITAKGLGDYTNELPNITVGTNVLIDGPHGVFTAKKITQSKVLFIAGGIGITPIWSIIESLGKAAKSKDAILLYGNKTKSDIVFLEKLDELTQKTGVKIINILSNEKVSGFENGYIDIKKIRQFVPDVKDRDVFLCGPPQMMSSVKTALSELGVPKKHTHYESFAL